MDSSYDLCLGVLDDELNWLAYESHSGVKASAIIQERTALLLGQLDLKAADLSGVITVNGPGFYTGIRLMEGFANVLGFFGVRIFSFYSYDVPLWAGHCHGTWFTKAYRGEYFLYTWEGDSSFKNLVSSSELPTALASLNDQSFFIHSGASLDSLSASLLLNPISTAELIRVAPKKVFAEVLKGRVCEPYYFRAPEDEFKVNP